MDVFLFLPSQFQEYYNCSFYDPKTVPLENRQHYVVGATLIVLSLIFEVMYIPALIIMRKKTFFHQSCYKIMFAVGIVDVTCIVICGIITGIFAMEGVVYCSNPKLIYVLGSFSLGFWVFQTDAGIILAINRCLEMYNTKLCAKLFRKGKTYVWILYPILHSLYIIFFTRPILFNGIYLSWFFNPHAGYFDDYGVRYSNILHTINNITYLLCLLLLYTIFLIILIKKSKLIQGPTRTESQRQSFIQVLIICIINATVAAVYLYEQYFDVPDYVIIIGSYLWILAHGCPAAIYLIMNRSIRNQLWRTFGISKSTSSSAPNAAVQQKPFPTVTPTSRMSSLAVRY